MSAPEPAPEGENYINLPVLIACAVLGAALLAGYWLLTLTT